MKAEVDSVVHIRLTRGELVFDKQLSILLHLVDETGSIPDACDLAQMDLLTAWQMLTQTEDALGFPLLRYVQHKSLLTGKARKLLDACDEFEAAVQAKADRLLESIPFTEEPPQSWEGSGTIEHTNRGASV